MPKVAEPNSIPTKRKMNIKTNWKGKAEAGGLFPRQRSCSAEQVLQSLDFLPLLSSKEPFLSLIFENVKGGQRSQNKPH